MIKELLWFPTDKCFIDGSWNYPEKNIRIDLLNPFNGKVLSNIVRASAQDVDAAVLAVETALNVEWDQKSASHGGRCI